MFAVVITEKSGAQRRIECEEAEVTIGRVQGNDVVLPKGNVSKRHARIVLRDNRFIVVDLKSTNGTYVNGRKISSPLVVKEGDKIYVGDFILTLQRGASQLPAGGASSPPESMHPPSALPPVLGMSDEETSPPSSPHTQTTESVPPESKAPSVPRRTPPPPIEAPPSKGPDRSADLGPMMGRLERDFEAARPRLPSRPGSHTEDFLESKSFDAAVLGDLSFLGRFSELLYDGTVQRIEVTRHDRVLVDRGRGLALDRGVNFASPLSLETALRKLCQTVTLDESLVRRNSFELVDGTHVSALWPPLTSAGPTAVFARRPQTVRSLAELQNAGMLDGSQAQELRAALSARENILVVGPRRTQRSAVANALLSQLEAGALVVAIEHGAELGPKERMRLGLRWPEHDLDSVLRHADAFEVDRWLLHGAPTSEAALLLPLLASRADGSICTVQAATVHDALEELRAHAGSLGERSEGLLASAFPVVVELGLNNGRTRVDSVARLRVREGRASAA